MISAEAVEAAAKVLNLYVADDFDAVDADGQMQRDAARSILEAAAPHMLAEAWQDAHMAGGGDCSVMREAHEAGRPVKYADVVTTNLCRSQA